jgi:hypothetical protein
VPKNSKRRDDVRRVNKDRRAKLDELRRQQRAAERRKNFLFIGSAVVVAVALIGAAVLFAVLKSNANAAKSKTGYTAPLTAAERTAGCTGVHNDPVPAGGQHVAAPIDYTKQKYGDTKGGTAPIPPSGGEHNGVSLGDKVLFYPLAQKPRPERAVHNLEHGYVVVWYDDKLPVDQVAKLQVLTSQPSLSRMLAVGWWQSDLPAGKHVVLTSWGRTERCGTVSDAVIRNFYTKHLNSPLAPESGAGAIPGADTVPAGQLPGATPSPSASAAPTSSPTSTKK